MAATRRMTRQVQIGLSHSEKAKKLSFNGFYEEALKELNIALRAFESENRTGLWDDAVAGVLNNAGFVYLFLGNYQGAEDTFRSAMGLKERLGDRRSLAATLAGMADAYRGQCRFSDAASVLDDALDIAVSVKDDGMAKTLMASMDALERTRCDMPDAAYKNADFDELYVPKAGADVSARLAYLGIKVAAPDEINIEAYIGFPYLMHDLADAEHYGKQLFPVMSFLFPKGVESRLTHSAVTDEEEHEVGSSVSSFDGIMYGPGSYHRGGPQPMPACKQYMYTYGAGHVLEWHVGANGWYHVEASIKANMDDGLRLMIAMPFGSVKLRSTAVSIDDPGTWSVATLAGGTFLEGRSLETTSLPFVPQKALYEGPAKGKMKSDTGTTLKYGVLCLELTK